MCGESTRPFSIQNCLQKLRMLTFTDRIVLTIDNTQTDEWKEGGTSERTDGRTDGRADTLKPFLNLILIKCISTHTLWAR